MNVNIALQPLRRVVSACALALIIVPATTTPTYAAFYKCVSADGSTTYNDAPCAADQSTHLLSKSARELSVLDCRIARNFAFDALARMRQKDSAQDVFQAYGGSDQLSEGARTLINYIFSFQDESLVSSQRIVDVTIERCQAGLLSKALDQCDTFPKGFIERFGGCIKARESEPTVLIQAPTVNQLSGNSSSDGGQTSPPTLNAAQPDTQAIDRIDSRPDAPGRQRQGTDDSGD